ncbi:MAG: hypothetical protein ABI552_02045 [Casimicrobiaceae bacterium]
MWGVRPSPDAIDITVSGLQASVLAWCVSRAYAMTTSLPHWWRRAVLGLLVACASWAALSVYRLIVFATTLISLWRFGSCTDLRRSIVTHLV